MNGMLSLTKKITLLNIITLFLINKAHALDIEIDPIAYALNGHSLHFGFGNDYVRFDIGSFGLEAPTSLHGNEDYDLEFQGYGIKLDYLFGQYEGFFMGLQANSAEVTYKLLETSEKTTRTQISVGPRIGYRFLVDRNITITPWLGIDFNLEHDDVVLNGNQFETELVTFFPTVHLGWRF